MKLHQRNLPTAARQHLPEPRLGPGAGTGAGAGACPGKYEKQINKNFMKVSVHAACAFHGLPSPFRPHGLCMREAF